MDYADATLVLLAERIGVLDVLTLAARGESRAGRVTRVSGLAGGFEQGRRLPASSALRLPMAARNPLGGGHLGPLALSFAGEDRRGSPSSSLLAERPQEPAARPTGLHHGLLDRRGFSAYRTSKGRALHMIDRT